MKKISLLFISLSFCLTTLWGQTSISPEIQTKIKTSVFEIIIDKIEDKNITYEKPLPYDKLPYAIRTDKYTPIGTAFLLNDGTFWSASHVFSLYGDTVYTNYYIRDSKGKTYPIDKITALSNTRDFISFTVPSFIIQNEIGLSMAEEYNLNSVVFSVGNAQGEGIIIRDGMLTSQTPENFNGEWNWLRFSAAANPGNSGGPLINADGEVIGIITMKNENENLNYALPIKEIETGKNKDGYVDYRFYYRLPNILNHKEYHQYNYSIKLPATYSELHAELTKVYKEQIQSVVNKMRDEYNPDSPKGFAASKDFPSISYNSYISDTPMTVFLSNQENWEFGSTKSNTYQMDDNGSIEYQKLLNYYTFTITKPDSLSLEKMYKNPKLYMDHVTKLLNLTRPMGSEKVKIKSLGNPSESSTYQDYFGRTWFVDFYSIDFADSMILTYSLPLPTGMYIILKMDSRTSITAGHYLDMAFVADHTYTNYFGHINDWKEYLACGASDTIKLSDLEKSISLNFTENDYSVSVDNLSLTLNDELLALSDDNRINIRTGYTKKDGRTILESRGFIVYSNPKSDNYKYFSICKIRKPMTIANRKIQEQWQQIKNKVSPFNDEPYNHERYTFLNSVIIPQDNDNPDILYELGFELLNQNKNEEIKNLEKEIISNLQIQ